MKKVLCILAFVTLFCSGYLWAQPVAGYSFSNSPGTTYSSISNPTVVFSTPDPIPEDFDLDNLTFNNSSTGTKEAVSAIGYPIGFNFKYSNIEMNRFAINSNGSITLGKDLVASIGDRINFGFDEEGISEYNYLIGCMVTGGTPELTAYPTTKFQYALTGNAPNRILTVEFLDLGQGFSWGDILDTFNFQIKLYESSNKIEFVFGNCTLDKKVNEASISCGLRGNSVSDLNLRAGKFANPTQTTKASQLEWGNDSYPTLGQSYTLTPPPSCIAPTTAPSNFVCKQNSTSLTASFTPATDADYYLVVQTTTATHSAAPVKGTTYEQGASLGNGSIAFWFPDTTFSIKELEPNTNYYYHIYPANYLCTGGVSYGSNILTSNVKMHPAAPAELHISTIGTTSLSLSGTANATNPKMLVLMTLDADVDGTGVNTTLYGKFGAPSFNLEVGDTAKDKEGKNTNAVVVYKGANFTDLAVNNLMSGRLYHFGAFSLNETDGTCSSLFASDDTLTNGVVPWIAQLDGLSVFFDDPYGWECTGPKTVSLNRNANREYVFQWRTQPNNSPIVNTLESAFWITMSKDFENRLLFNYNITSFAGTRFNNPYNDWGTDSLEFQYTENGSDYTTFFIINQQNRDFLADVNAYASKRFFVKGAQGKTIKLRLRWTTSKDPQLIFRPLEIEEFHPCDYPLNVSIVDSTVEGSKGLVKWDALNEESLWNIRYQTVGSNTWSEPIAANSNPYLVTTLAPNSILQIQVQAKCTQEDLSPWSKPSKAFQSGYAVPFLENFNQAATTMPPYWYSKRGPFSDVVTTKELIDDGNLWTRKGVAGASDSDKGLKLALDGTPEAPIQGWLLSPIVNLGTENVHYQLEFNAFLTISNSSIEPPTSLHESMAFSIVISTDGGKTFLKTNTLKTYNSVDNSLLNIGTRSGAPIVLNLSAYSGDIQIGFFGYSTGMQPGKNNTSLFLDNIAIQPTCPSPNKAAFTEVTSTEATLTFESTSGAEKWIVGIKKTADANYTYTDISEKSYTFTDLTPRTAYDIRLTNVCTVGDTAAWLNLKFTSLSLEACAMPTALTAKNITKTSATLAWTGDASNYKVKFKSETASTWIEESVSTNEFPIEALAVGTKYVYMVQSVCSQAMGDTSEWTAIANFTTAAITCHPPTELKADAIKHSSAHLTWTSTASNYQAAYRIGETNAWTVQPATAKEVQFTGLNPVSTYNARVRAICAANDTSNWTSVISFTTLSIPSCDVPTNLSSSNITTNSAKLAWEANASNEGWLVRYRSSTETVWDSIKNLTVKTATLENLQVKTAYLWSVQGNCDEGRITPWATQANFTTEGISIETEAFNNGLRIFADKGQIHLLNPNEFFIERIELYNTNGQRVQEHIIRSTENVIINTTLSATPIIVRVYGKNKISNFKVLIK